MTVTFTLDDAPPPDVRGITSDLLCEPLLGQTVRELFGDGGHPSLSLPPDAVFARDDRGYFWRTPGGEYGR